jgi:hypothetical protein
MRHKHRHLAVLSTLAILALAITASAANATILYEWKIKGAALKTGESKTVTLKTKPKTAIKWAVNLPGSELEGTISSSEVKFAETAKMIGGKPGEIEGELIFDKPTYEVAHGGGHCIVEGGRHGGGPESLRTILLLVEVVESAEAKKGTGKTELLFRAQSGGTGLVEIEIGGKECIGVPTRYEDGGTMLAEIAPQKSEAKVTKLSFAKSGSEYRNAKGEFKTSVIEAAGELQPITGETELELVSKEAFGAF